MLPVEHLAEVLVDLGARIELEYRCSEVGVDVAKGHDLFAPAAGHIVPAHAADAHGCDAEFIAGSLIAGASQHMAGNH
jgi:hypothetical protein